MAQLQWGLLCTARINRYLIPQLRASDRSKLTAVSSRSADRAANYAKEWNIPRAYGSYNALLADPEIDVVYNALPNHLHAKWTINCLAAGKHVLCEKPLALTIDEVDDIIEAAHEAGSVVAEAFMYRHHARTLRVEELVRNDTIGELQIINGAFRFNLDRPNDYRWDPERGGGSLWDVGCYPLSFARTLIGQEPEKVFGYQRTSETGIDVTFAGQLRFPNNTLVQIDSSFRAPGRMHMEIVGSRGTIRMPRAFKPGPTSTILLEIEGTEETVKVEGGELYRGEIEDMADAILSNTPPRISLADSRGNVRAITALLASARSGDPVQLE
jgi:predicted dehydrogenase